MSDSPRKLIVLPTPLTDFMAGAPEMENEDWLQGHRYAKQQGWVEEDPKTGEVYFSQCGLTVCLRLERLLKLSESAA